MDPARGFRLAETEPPAAAQVAALESGTLPVAGSSLRGEDEGSARGEDPAFAAPTDPSPHAGALAADNLRRLIGSNVRDIVNQFIVNDAVMEINISSRSRSACLKAARASEMGDGIYTFARPARHVRQTLRRDTFPRFVSSPTTTEWFARRPWEVER